VPPVTEELFRDDAYLKACDARITAVIDGAIVLDRTVFYPQGGGQPGDRGSLRFANGVAVEIADTRKDPNGSIIHIPADGSTLPQPEATVRAEIDWARRYLHMRTHTCLHLLCALIPYPVTSGSISQDKGRLDFDMIDTVDKAALEIQLQNLITADHPVICHWISDEEMNANADLVRTMSVAPPVGEGRVRLIDVEGVDRQACGGTHVARTGEIGAVRIGKVEKKGRHNRRINLHLD
jgi:misacylated tRNA(Ala) deacylase